MYNIQINSIILLSILSGIIVIFMRVFLYSREYDRLLSFDKLSREEISKLKIIKPISLYISKTNRFISQQRLQTILASIEKKIDDYSYFPKYISGILIFLGLLGTFWGLSHTIGNVAEIIDKLGVEQQDASSSFMQLKNSLKIPLSGMGIAFGCSLFGLSGSILIGFLHLNQKKVGNELLEKIEEWITKKTISFDIVDNNHNFHGEVFSMALLEKTIEMIYNFQGQMSNIEGNRLSIISMQSEMSEKITELTNAMNSHQELLKVLSRNQMELQSITVSLNNQMNDNVFSEISKKLETINISINNLTQDSIDGRKIMIQSLGSDIRMISKTLSSLIRE